jgi:signal transduction histidine kinase/ActR/RegA family two-component response regulator
MVSPRDETFDYLANVPLCMIALDEKGRAVQINETCQAHFGPLFKYSAATFSSLATDSVEHRAKLEGAMKQARLSTAEASNGAPNGPQSQPKSHTSCKARNIEMLTLSEDLPIKKHFDWTIGVGRDGQILLFGDAVTEQDEEERAKDAAAVLLRETKRSLEMLDQFMSRSLHHLRTPLHVLQSTCDLVLENLRQIQQQETESADDKMVKASALQESVTLLDGATEHIASAVVLIDDISDMARLDRGLDFEINKEWITLSTLGESAVSSVQAKSDVKVNFHLPKGGPAYLYSDPKLLQKVLRHLLENAVQVTECGSITLMIGEEDKRCSIAVVVTETGSVVPDEPGASAGNGVESNEVDTKLPAIFQRYHQVLLPEETLDMEEATSLRDAIEFGVGSLSKTLVGIGLSLSYHLVLALGGDIRYSSQPGLTKFWFSLPQENLAALPPKPTSVMPTSHERIAKSDMKFFQQSPDALVPFPASKKRAASKDQENEAKGREMKLFKDQPIIPVPVKDIPSSGLNATDPPSILVVEDTAMCAKLLCMVLRKSLCSATWVDNGQKAVDLLRESLPGTYSLILMDLRMPVMDGLTATAIIKKELKNDIPVIALTGDTSADVKGKCEEIGFAEYCVKPMKKDQLLAIIQKYTGFQCVQKEA